jgi:Uma2 family endonuclease
MSSLDNSSTPVQPGAFSVGGSSPPTEYRFSVDEFRRLHAEGFFPADARLELLEGTVVMMSPEGDSHFKAVMRCQRNILPLIFGAPWETAMDRSLQLPASLLEPDLMLLRGVVDDYPGLPVPANLGLVIEVADSSRYYDRLKKIPVYASVGIPECWIVNIPERKLEVYRRPLPATGDESSKYQSIEMLVPEQSIDLVLDGTKFGSIVVRQLLPKA